MSQLLSSEEAQVVGLDVYQRVDGLYDWRFLAANGQEQCSSLQGYTSAANARRGFAEFMKNAVSFMLSGLLDEAEKAESIESGDVESAREALSDG
jgi:uncharacterized protein YegP (UPF0339 family)